MRPPAQSERPAYGTFGGRVELHSGLYGQKLRELFQ
jgi:hypothetical protein